MDTYMAATAKAPMTECSQRLKPEEIAQVKPDFCQNSAHLSHMSFIPVYSNKTVCHKFANSKTECGNQSENTPCERKNLSTYSPPVRPRCPANNDVLAARMTKTHMRRRSVGFEDMTSLASYYGHNFSNDRRFQGSGNNYNISQSSTENHSPFLHSDNAQSTGKSNQSENTCCYSWNHNAQITSRENANEHQLRRPERYLKDKSSKRKSSLNRMDFIHFPSPNTGSSQYPTDFPQKNSSSDEGPDSKTQTKKAESPSCTSKRKHSSNSCNNMTSKPEVKVKEVTPTNGSLSKLKSNLLPKSSQTNHTSSKQTKWKHSSKIRFSQKLSHSAGELENLTDFSEVPSRNKTYLSAQEFGEQENSNRTCSPSGLVARHSFQKFSPTCIRKNEDSSPVKHTCDITSQIDAKSEFTQKELCIKSKENNLNDLVASRQDSCDIIPQSFDQKDSNSVEINLEQTDDTTNPVVEADCDDNAGVDESVVKLESLDISDSSKNSDVYVSADESGDAVGSDGERRRSSILRKKNSEERKELHSILKPPPDDKLSKTPPSILKHRESSEEKDTWQPNDLHSILKKSTSEDESCNSGTDIRPILKFSTDEDSPSGVLRPRPILKKRTSFSDECSYASYPSGELKPILKKKTPLSSEDQPKPILKSRRKSEDTRSTTSEVITSRPRAYSADMGVKMSHEGQIDNKDLTKDFCSRLESKDL